MKKSIFMTAMLFVMCTCLSFAGEPKVYSDSDLEQYKGGNGYIPPSNNSYQPDYRQDNVEQDRREREEDRRVRQEEAEKDRKMMIELKRRESCEAYHNQVARCKARNGNSPSCYSIWDESHACE